MTQTDQKSETGARNTKIGAAVLLALAVIPIVMDLDVFGGDVKADPATTVQWVSYEEAVRLSGTSGKKLLVDLYTDWCTWCKKMDAEVYTAPDVRAQITKHFIPVKLNAESSDPLEFKGSAMTKAQFSRAVGVTGFPSTLFLTEGQDPITLVPGFIPAERFSLILEYIGDDHYTNIPFETFVAQRPATP